MLLRLEPRYEYAKTVILCENEEWLEVLFFNKGLIGIGFELNKVIKFVVTMEGNAVLGAYGCSFNKKSQFVYKTMTYSSGYSIRKSSWVNLHTNHEMLASSFIDSIGTRFDK